jgi:UDP-N-acetyl-D-mannosaminuronate dehydrogenase
LGLTFKADTKDLRKSPALEIVRQVLADRRTTSAVASGLASSTMTTSMSSSVSTRTDSIVSAMKAAAPVRGDAD